jgi:hypothetical protein
MRILAWGGLIQRYRGVRKEQAYRGMQGSALGQSSPGASALNRPPGMTLPLASLSNFLNFS